MMNENSSNPPEQDSSPTDWPTVVVPSSKRSDSFSLSALFLLMVAAASLFGLIRQAVPGLHPNRDGTLQSGFSVELEIRKDIAFGCLFIIGIIAGSRRGWKLQHRKSGAALGMFFSVVAITPACMILATPPSWPMVILSCVMLIGSGYLLRMGQSGQKPTAKTTAPE